MFEEKDLNFRETFSSARGIVKSNSKVLRKMCIKCLLIFSVLFIVTVLSGLIYAGNSAVVFSFYAVAFIIFFVTVTKTRLYAYKLFYGSLYEKNYTKEEVTEFTKKRRFKYLGMMVLLAIAAYGVNIGMIFIMRIFSNFIGVTPETIQENLFNDVFFNIKYIIIVVMSVAIGSQVTSLSSLYRYELATNPVDNMGIDIPFKVVKGKSKEFLKLLAWNLGIYIFGLLFMYFTASGLAYFIDFFMIHIVSLIIFFVYFYMVIWLVVYFEAFGNVKYLNMRNMLYGKPKEEVCVELSTEEQNDSMVSSLNKNDEIESEENNKNV